MSTRMGAIDVKLLEAEVTELLAAVSQQDVAAVLDEVTDVIYRARHLAYAFGLTDQTLDQYSGFKGRLQSKTDSNFCAGS